MAAGTDVNQIVNHYRMTGIDPYIERSEQQQFGYASSQTFEDALRATAEIQSAFEALPSKIRSEFSNDSGAWLDSLTVPPPEVVPETPPEPSPEPTATPPAPAPAATPSAELDST